MYESDSIYSLTQLQKKKKHSSVMAKMSDSQANDLGSIFNHPFYLSNSSN